MSARRFGNVVGAVGLAATGARVQLAQLINRIQNARLGVRLQGTITVTGGPAGAVRNGGWLSAAMQFVVSENGRDTFQQMSGRLFRALAQSMSAQPLLGQSLPASANLAVGVYQIDEFLPIDFVNRLAVDPYETAYMEADPSSRFTLDGALLLNAVACLVAPNGGSTITLTNVTATVEQYGDPARGSLPLFTPNLRIISQDVPGANGQHIIYTPTRARLRSMLVAPVATTVDGGIVPAADAINALRLIGDDGRNIIGPNQTPWDFLLADQALAQGGTMGENLLINFQDGGRLGNTIVPAREYPNLRLELNDQPSALGTTRVEVVLSELTRTPPFNGYATVTEKLPDWLS